jgi:hypothetical protein
MWTGWFGTSIIRKRITGGARSKMNFGKCFGSMAWNMIRNMCLGKLCRPSGAGWFRCVCSQGLRPGLPCVAPPGLGGFRFSQRFRAGLPCTAPPGLDGSGVCVPRACALGYPVSPLRGLAVLVFPALPRWATLYRPSGAGWFRCVRSQGLRPGLPCVAPPGLGGFSVGFPSASALGYPVPPLRGFWREGQ